MHQSTQAVKLKEGQIITFNAAERPCVDTGCYVDRVHEPAGIDLSRGGRQSSQECVQLHDKK